MRHGIVVVAALVVAAFTASFAAGSADVTGQVMGGTEIRNLVAHDGRLFAANGYWKDTSELSGSPGAQILVLDNPNAPWRVEHVFNDRLPDGQRRHLAISAMTEATFRTDAKAAPLPAPASFLLASSWDVTGRRTVFARDDHSGEWVGSVLAQERPSKDFLPQIRSFGFHRDRSTGVDLVFAGDSQGIFRGWYEAGVPGGPAEHIQWMSTPELSTDGLAADGFPGLAGRLRISSFAEAQGRVFAANGQQVWVRQDGAAAQWRLFHSNSQPNYSQTGLRGLTTVSESGTSAFLLAAVEGRQSRIVRIDPLSGAETTDLELSDLLDKAWGTRVSYVVAAYNDMAKVGSAGEDLVIGLEAFIPPGASQPPGHTVLDVVHGLEAGGWFLIRHPSGHYELRQVTASFPVIGLSLVAVRSIVASPFAGERGAMYFAGYDANDSPAHDTAWIARGIFVEAHGQ